MSIQHVVGRKGLDLPVSGDVCIAKHDGDVELVALDIFTYFICGLPVESDGHNLDSLGIPPATQPVQVAGTGRTNPAPGRKKIDQRRSRTRIFQVVRPARESQAAQLRRDPPVGCEHVPGLKSEHSKEYDRDQSCVEQE